MKCYVHLPLQILLYPIITKEEGDLVISICNCFGWKALYIIVSVVILVINFFFVFIKLLLP